ncbi:YadA-like family protein [Haemophilus haemolyticus]|uniref:YadA-like C-terminal region n=1 Tax=Haemophilus haemolyticus TaxID=726 RepID=A0A2X4R475_HAEHA|nr:YadA-like family protein [Haemophilus haemolyticus]SQH96641.1 YadA-like C-terminal region [Haemophilus haemolyticus]
MNNIFKVIWNHATQTWTAVGELASAKGKSKSVKLAVISTALLVAATGVEAANVVSEAGELGQLSIATNKVTDQFFGNDRYKAETKLSKNVAGATVHAYDGIAIGNGAVSGAPAAPGATGGNAHVAIGLMAHASGGGANGQNAAVALGAYSLATGQGGTAIGAHSIADALNSTALGKVAKANGDGSTAVGTNTRAEWQGTALGNTAEALANYATSIGVNSKANSHSSISIGRQAVVSGQNAIGMGTQTQVNGDGTVAVGSSTNVSSKNVSTLGSNINVGSGRDGAVVLGHGSDAGGDSVVTAVNSATAAGSPLIYKGFAGNLGDKSKDATNSEASNQGRIVSVGDDTKKIQVTTEVSNGTKTTTTVIKNLITKEVTEIVETSTIKDGKDTITKVVNDITDPNNKKVKVPSKTEVKDTKAQPHQDSAKQVGPEQTIYGERQIQHVAAGEITAGSTNAINGSQLYQVAKTLGTAAKGLADTLGVELDEDGNLITPFKHTLNTSTSNYTGDKDASNVTTALTQLNAYVNAGWTVGNNAAEDVSKILPNGKVNFVNGEGTTSTVTANGTNGANVTFNVKKDVTANATTGLKDGGANNVLNVGKDGVSVVSGTIDKATKETKGEVKAKDAKDNQVATVKNVVDAINSAGFVVSNGKSDKSELINAGKTLTLKGGNGVNVEQEGSNFTFSIDSSTLLEGKTGNITVDEVKKAGETDAGKATVNNNDVTKLATVKNVADAINGAKWFAKVENLSDSMNVRTQNDKDAEAQAMGAGDILTLKADKNLAVKREGKDVTYGLASEIEVDKITVKAKAGETVKGTTVENGKVTNLDDHLKAPTKVTGGDVVNATEVKTPTLTDAEKKEAATVNDVLNAGWNLKTNGNQAAAITNGKGLDFASDDNSVTITPTVDKDGNAKVNFSVNATSVINNNKGTIKEAATDPKAANAGTVTVSDADKGKLATVDTVAEAINSAATFVKVADTQEVITASTADDNGVAVKSGETVTHTAGKNLKVKRDKQSITYALAQDIDVNSVKATNGVTIGSGDNATKITSDDKGLNLAGKNGAATNINNVKDADLNATSKQAVNGSQLHATNEKVANLGTTVKNLNSVVNRQAGAIDSLDRKVNKHSKQARAGIAGANAAAALPQAYTQGKAMVAAAAGTFKGQNALAVGYSRISDNGKVILKLQGNANTSGDVGAGVGVGYQW